MDVLKALNQLRCKATASEANIIDYLLAHYPVHAVDSLQQIADSTGCSIPTVQRMVVKLGFDGFPAFRRAVLADFSQEKHASPLTRMQQASLIPHHQHTAIYRQTISNIEATFANLPNDVLTRTAKILANEAYTVWCLGGRFTGTLATLFARHLKTLRHHVREYTPYTGALADIYADTGKQTVLFVTDIRRYDESTIKLCEAAHRKGAIVILVTDNWLSPAEKSADIVIPVNTNSPSGWDSNACLLVVLEEIMGSVTLLLGEEGKANLQKREEFLNDVGNQ